MLRSVGVPTKVVTGYTVNATVYHAWNNVYDNSKWNVVDATYDAQMYRAKRSYSMYKSFSDYKDIVYTYYSPGAKHHIKLFVLPQRIK